MTPARTEQPQRHGWVARWATLPLVFYLLVFLVYPSLYAIRIALTDPLTHRSPSAANLRELCADGMFWAALRNNLVLPAASVLLELALGLGLAVLFARRLPARRTLRAIVVLPYALPEIVFLSIMRNIFAPRGYANAAIAAIGTGPVEWLLPERLTTFLTVVIVDAWHVTPIVFLMLLAALTAIPEEVTQAAQLDGAHGWRAFVFVTLPLLRPALTAALLLRGIDALRMFATPLVLAGVEGMPVLSTYAYHQWSDYGNDGAAAAAAMALALLSVLLSVPLLRWRMRA